MSNLFFYLKILYLFLAKRIIPPSMISQDYNGLAPEYDKYFSAFVKPNSQELVKRLEIKDESRVLDLACGTGTLTCEIEKYTGSNGKITAIDASDNMIKVAKGKVHTNVNFLYADMLKIIPTIADNNFDFVTCGWAIGYSHPPKLLKSIKRILKKQAKVGIIENRQDTLWPLRDTGIKVMKRYSRDICYLMDLPLRLPKCKSHLEKLFIGAGLKVVDLWDGEVVFNFKSGAEVLNWALHTGASAGFDKVMDPKAREKCDKAFIEIIERDYKKDGGISISHKFVAGIAQKI